MEEGAVGLLLSDGDGKGRIEKMREGIGERGWRQRRSLAALPIKNRSRAPEYRLVPIKRSSVRNMSTHAGSCRAVVRAIVTPSMTLQQRHGGTQTALSSSSLLRFCCPPPSPVVTQLEWVTSLPPCSGTRRLRSPPYHLLSACTAVAFSAPARVVTRRRSIGPHSAVGRTSDSPVSGARPCRYWFMSNIGIQGSDRAVNAWPSPRAFSKQTGLPSHLMHLE